LGQKPVQVQGKFLGRPTEEESEEFLAKLKLLLEGKLVQSLVNLKLLAEMRMDSSLLKLEFLLGKREIESGEFEASGWAEYGFISGEAGTFA
jgi:hypothetical protein